MARKRSRIEGLKMPFVVTVTMATGACGGTVTSSSDGRDVGGGGGAGGLLFGGGGAGGQELGGSGGMNPVGCPPTAPSNGTPCFVVAGESCHFPGGPCQATVDATCVNSAWSTTETYEWSCNPPPPPDTVCPAAEPMNGTYCNYSGPPCEYSRCFGSDAVFASCAGQTWTVSVPGSCDVDAGYTNPPYPIDAGAGGAPGFGGSGATGGAAPASGGGSAFP